MEEGGEEEAMPPKQTKDFISWILRKGGMREVPEIYIPLPSLRIIKPSICFYMIWRASVSDEESFSYFFRTLSYDPTDISLWYGLKDMGDGWQRGHLCELEQNLSYCAKGAGGLWGIREQLFDSEMELQIRKYHEKSNRRKQLKRIEVVKQLFHAFINRSQAYDYPNHIGLVVFSSNIEYKNPLSPLYENFRKAVDKSLVFLCFFFVFLARVLLILTFFFR